MTEPDARPTNRPRSRRKVVWAAVAVVLVIGIAVGLALFQPWRLFTRSTVDEALPGGPAGAAAGSSAGSSAVIEAAADATTGTTAGADAATTVTASALPATEPTSSRQPAPQPAAATPATTKPPAPETAAPVPPAAEPAAPGPAVLATGGFVDGEHATTGTASILRLPDGSRYVRLEGFSTSDGPDVQVWVTDQRAGGDDWGKYDDGRYVELGTLKGTDGNQNYAVPANADLTGLTSVVIWCDRFNVAFGSAAVAL